MLKKTLSSLLSLALVLGISLVHPAEVIPGAQACYNYALDYPKNAKPNEVVTYMLDVGTFPNKPRRIIVDIKGGAKIKSVSSQPAGAGFNGANIIELPGNFLGQVSMNIQMPSSGNVEVIPRFEGDASDCSSSTAEFGTTTVEGPEPIETKPAAPDEEEEKGAIIGDPVVKTAKAKPTSEPTMLPGTGPKENALLILMAILGLLIWKRIGSRESSNH